MPITITDLPPAVLLRIGQHVFDPKKNAQPSPDPGADLQEDKDHKRDDFHSLVALSTTCHLLRFAVGPLVLSRVVLPSRDSVLEVLESEWTFDIESVTVPLSDFDPDESTCWADALLLFNLLSGLPGLKHLGLRLERSLGQDMTLAILSTLLDPPPVPHILMTSRRAIPSLQQLRSLALVFVQAAPAACHSRFLEATFPLLDQLPDLRRFVLAYSAENPEPVLAPQLQPLLPHLPPRLEHLTLAGEFQEAPEWRTVLIRKYCPNLRSPAVAS